jgi:chemotaxis response regulator CheB
MKKIKILLSSRPKLLSEVIRNMIEHQPDMIVVGEVIDPLQLLNAVKKTIVDVIIITPLKANGEPKICSMLLSEFPLLIIVTQSVNADRVYLYQSGVPKQHFDQASSQSILMVIRESIANNRQLVNGSKS